MTPDQVLEFWFPEAPTTLQGMRQCGRTVWGAGPALDEPVRTRFSDAIGQGVAGEYDGWCGSLRGKLALIVLLDQLPRHAYRATPQQYVGDAHALEVTRALVDSREICGLDPTEQSWALMPLLHAEHLGAQERSVIECERLRGELPDFMGEAREGMYERAQQYRDIITWFGRFPFRNAVLGRESTREEKTFLESFVPGPPRGIAELTQNTQGYDGDQAIFDFFGSHP